jgi:indole-3-glycerol phosphate synthase
MHGVLQDIIAHKREEVAHLKASTSFEELEAQAMQAEPARNFFAAVTQHPDAFHVSVIAEIKRRSPSAGLIRPEYASVRGPRDRAGAMSEGAPPGGLVTGDRGGLHASGSGHVAGFDPAHVARRYADNGAAAISCLTDEHYFGGHLSFIERVKDAVGLPVLRKDFIIDPIQLWESRAAGADAVLLIAEVLTIAEIVDMLILSQRLGLTVLLEAHSVDALLRIRPHVGFPHPSYCLLGINNRDLSSQTVDINHTLRLLDMVDDPSVLVSESGIRTNKDVTWLRHHNVRIVLVGESLMRQADPGAGLAELLGRPPR